MASSTAQIHALGIGFSSSRKPNHHSARRVFFGQRVARVSPLNAAFLRLAKTNNNGQRYNVGPVRVVNEKVVGIDLGTTNSAVAAMEGGKPTIVTNAEGQRTTPSVVAYTKTGDRLVGQIAKRQAVVNPENTFFSVKRFIGRKMSEVDEESKQISYRVIRDENGNVKLDCPAIGKQFAAEEISAQRIVDWLAENFKRDEGIDVLKDKQALQRLPFITATADGPKHIETTITRVKFEELCSDLLDRLKTPVENSLRDAKLSFKDIDEVILVGGSTRIPAVQELVRKMTGKDPNVTVNPDEVVALGAAVQAGVLSGDVSDIVLLDDKERRDAVDTKNQADSVVYQTGKQLKELGDKVPGPVKEKVEAKLQELRDAISGGSTAGMKDAMSALNQEVMQLGQSLYNQPGAAGGAAGPAPGGETGPSDSSNKGPDGDVIDADFTDSK
ncbi:Stromal 70 kDa heat shock-related protein [Hibiscus syriacus]|uniref:Stromal 70 kDa heat shock-related protein n=1 Tax=Hibiscus syriacus TaxID=106335 RepID=A0A6A2XEW5_HIBSY|nr:Stromal 70 kDa heat shock-related protein [Hibiscus syriacus]